MNMDRILFSGRKHQNYKYKTESDKEICESKNEPSISYINHGLENDIVHGDLTKIADENRENSVVDEEAETNRSNTKCDDAQNVDIDKKKSAHINIDFYCIQDEDSSSSET